METRSEIWVAYLLTGDTLNPSDVTALTGLQPTKVWAKDDLVAPVGRVRRKTNGWRLTSGLPLDAVFGDQLRALLSKLRTAWPVFADLGQRFDAEIEAVVESYGGDWPAIHIDKAEVRAVAELNADIDVDLYIFS